MGLTGGLLLVGGTVAAVAPFAIQVFIGLVCLFDWPLMPLISGSLLSAPLILAEGLWLSVPLLPVAGPLVAVALGPRAFGGESLFPNAAFDPTGRTAWFLSAAAVQFVGGLLLVTADRRAHAERGPRPMLLPGGPAGTPGATLAWAF
jgi:hypothetical protein